MTRKANYNMQVFTEDKWLWKLIEENAAVFF